MKYLITIAAIAALGGFANAEETAKTVTKPKSGECAKSACDGAQGGSIKLAVAGLDKEGAAAAAQKKLVETAGVTHCGTCAKSGTVVVKYIPEIVGVDDIEKVIAGSGLKIAGHKASMKVKGMACQSCSNKLTGVLEGTAGIVKVDKVCNQSGTVAVTFDASKTDIKKIKAAINATQYKVVEGAVAEDCEKACDKTPAPQG